MKFVHHIHYNTKDVWIVPATDEGKLLSVMGYPTITSKIIVTIYQNLSEGWAERFNF